MRTKKVSIPIYYGTLVIIVSDDYKEVVRKYKIKTKKNVELYGAFVYSRIDKNGFPEYLVCIDEDISNHLLAHECVHLTNEIFLHTGTKLDRKNDEPQALLTGWCFKEIDKFLKNEK